nr:MAG TPA: putative tail-component [Caudoviricetes sp.]
MAEKYDANFFAQLFVSEAQKEMNGVSFRGGVQRGTGSIPYDTGRLAKSITMVWGDEKVATIFIGNAEETYYAEYLQSDETVGKTTKPNLHKGFVEKFITREYVGALRRFGKVTVSGGR